MQKGRKWFCQKCPLYYNCSPQSWDEAEVVSWESEEDCRRRLLKHLTQSDTNRKDAEKWGEPHMKELAANYTVVLEADLQQLRRWKCQKCPFHWNCSPQSWDEARVSSWKSEEDCRKRLLAHLTQTDIHRRDVEACDETRLKALVARTSLTLDVLELTQEEIDRLEADPYYFDRKRRRRESTPPDGRGAASGSSGSRGQHQEPPPSSCTAIKIRGMPISDTNAKVIQVSVAELTAIRENIARCHKTFDECIHVLTQGSGLFDTEQVTFRKAMQAMGLKLGKVGLCWLRIVFRSSGCN